jgi:hypothetical protein
MKNNVQQQHYGIPLSWRVFSVFLEDLFEDYIFAW